MGVDGGEDGVNHGDTSPCPYPSLDSKSADITRRSLIENQAKAKEVSKMFLYFPLPASLISG